ncbi:MAG: AAA family ATPase [Akkermansia sp.]
MPSTVNQDLFDCKSDILGIYGQNGTGKSSVIEALDLVVQLLKQSPITKDYARYIAKGKKMCQIRVDFLFQKGDFKAYLEYTVRLQVNQNDDNQGVQHFFAAFERLRYRKWDAGKGKFLRLTELFSFDASSPKVLNNAPLQKLLLENHEENQVEIALAIAAAQSQRCSILTSPQLVKLLSAVKHKKVSDLLFIINALNQYALFDAIVVSNEQPVFSNLAIPFFIRQVGKGRAMLGRIPIQLNGVALLHEHLINLLATPIENVNKVLASLIPGLQIELCNLGKELNEHGETCVRVQLLSRRGDLSIPLRCESAGIIKIVSILSALIHVFHHASVCLVVDELDAGIFEYLLGEILQTLDMHAKGQIIFTSHNLRALEMLRKESLMFSTTNPENRYIRMKNVKQTNNLRDQYYRAIQLGGQSEELYAETDRIETAKAFRQAIATKED